MNFISNYNRLIYKEDKFRRIFKYLHGWNKDQIDSCSRYLHSLSLAAMISIAGLPFSGGEVFEYALKALILLTLAIGLFLLGTYLLQGQKNV
jgi:hypothetical protein